ncbi:hypothetical protein WA026_011320 [Henosepilachna vigintioctopunctata]|uniref:Uncharacterized protein n=1 Tax=Henosepilachna vigintioctopunctata TaxID=420089 RepID=A0AAW1U687_9CUCU
MEKIHGPTEKEQDQLVYLSSCATMENISVVNKKWIPGHQHPRNTRNVEINMCEQVFSSMCFSKSKYRNRLDMRPDFRVKVSSLEPSISEIMDSKVKLNSSH